MGTRSLTVVKKDGKPLVCLFGMFDGYPSGHGNDLAAWLKGITIGNGLLGGEKMHSHANGIECLAAQLVARFKTSPGEFYLVPLDSGWPVDYTYEISENSGNILMEVWGYGQKLWSGSPSEWDLSLLE